ncbi:MAG: hypothetical protein Fur0041_05220 [Bacteroidia bacterium]
MKKFLLVIIAVFAGMLNAFATHNIAGEITVRCLNISTNTYEVTVTTYTNSLSPADRCELVVNWGDNVQTTISRSGGPTGSCPPPATMGVPLTQFANTQKNTYVGIHSYPGPGTYTISVNDPNRVAGIVNIPNSVNVAFYLQTTITINPFIGCNSTPVLTNIPLDKACRGKCFYHNPGAIDPDGDSLSYRIGPCLDTTTQPIVGYTFPQIAGGGNLSIDPVTGDLSWCAPQQSGKYNIVIYIDEWKKLQNGSRVLVSTILRDMSIDVIDQCNNENPDIPDLPDLCVDAGQQVNFNFIVTDPDAGDLVRLEGFGGPFSSTPAATLTPSNTQLSPPISANFVWNTTCENVRLQPWVVTFKATDNDPQVALTDIESVKITVVSPGPQSLTVDPQGSSMNLHWSQNPCNPTNNFVKGYKIYRRQGPSGWTPAQCETGVPAYTGFVLIGVNNGGLFDTTFVDNNGGAGLIPGVDYCYRVHAYFLDGAESYASPENCQKLKRDVPVITNVDVVSTGGNDTIQVKWINALANGIDFDTLQHPGPWVLTLERSTGFAFSNTVTIATITSSVYAQLATSYTDTGLNTAGTPYTYRINFFAQNGNENLGASQTASSVYLTTSPADNRVHLSWQSFTPWTNYEYAIFRYNPVTTVWDSIGLSITNTYTDSNLVNGSEYCYYINAHGSYYNASLPSLLQNRSQRACETPVDLTPPCPPQLIVNTDCYIGTNQLVWTNPMNMNCGTDDVVSYHIWYTETEGGTMQLFATINVASDTTITYNNLFSVAGCYAVTALDTNGNESPYSNIVCVDNCPYYELPNVFTPNGDNTNDFFIPFPYRYIESVDLKIYDRWGVLVFETTDPAVRWNGHDMRSGKLCTDGVYYYTCTVNEIRLQGIVPRELKGFVHLFGKNNPGE